MAASSLTCPVLHPVDVLVHAVWGCATDDEKDLEEAVRAEPDVRDELARRAQLLHRLSHLVRWRVSARRIVRVSHRKIWAAGAGVTRRWWPGCSGRRHPREKLGPEGRPRDGGCGGQAPVKIGVRGGERQTRAGPGEEKVEIGRPRDLGRRSPRKLIGNFFLFFELDFLFLRRTDGQVSFFFAGGRFTRAGE
jgi:hypothetical protein